MKDIDIEMLSAYLDQELSPEESKAVELQLKQEEKLRLIYRQMKAGADAIRQTIHQIDDAPLTTKLGDLMASIEDVKADRSQPASETVKTSILGNASVSGGNAGFGVRWFDVLRRISADIEARFSWSLNSVAAIVVLVAIGFFFSEDRQQPSIMQLKVGDTLGEASFVMNDEVSGSTTTTGRVAITQQMAFIARWGALCKRYSAFDGVAIVNAVACYKRQQWIVKVTEKSNYADVGGIRDFDSTEAPYQPASAASGSVVDAYIEKHIDDIPLTPEQERIHLTQLLSK